MGKENYLQKLQGVLSSYEDLVNAAHKHIANLQGQIDTTQADIKGIEKKVTEAVQANDWMAALDHIAKVSEKYLPQGFVIAEVSIPQDVVKPEEIPPKKPKKETVDYGAILSPYLQKRTTKKRILEADIMSLIYSEAPEGHKYNAAAVDNSMKGRGYRKVYRRESNYYEPRKR